MPVLHHHLHMDGRALSERKTVLTAYLRHQLYLHQRRLRSCLPAECSEEPRETIGQPLKKIETVPDTIAGRWAENLSA